MTSKQDAAALLCEDCGHHLHRPDPGPCQWHGCRCGATSKQDAAVPRTKAGQAYLEKLRRDDAGMQNLSSGRFHLGAIVTDAEDAILAIEAEAATPVADDALRATLERLLAASQQTLNLNADDEWEELEKAIEQACAALAQQRSEPGRDLSVKDLIGTLRWITEQDGGFPVEGGHREQELVKLWERRLRLPQRSEPAVGDEDEFDRGYRLGNRDGVEFGREQAQQRSEPAAHPNHATSTEQAWCPLCRERSEPTGLDVGLLGTAMVNVGVTLCDNGGPGTSLDDVAAEYARLSEPQP